MTNSLTLRTITLCILLIGALLAPVSYAHPHAWIDLRTSVVRDATGRIIAIEQEWLLDPLYSTVLVEDLGASDAVLRAHGADMLGRLKPFNYFTEVRVNGAVQSPAEVSEFETALRSKRFWLRFVMPLSEPVDAKQQSIDYAVFDPTYYVEMLHLADDVVQFIGPNPAQCSADIAPPQPTTAAIIRAQSRDVDKNPDNSLGALFAERVGIVCQ